MSSQADADADAISDVSDAGHPSPVVTEQPPSTSSDRIQRTKERQECNNDNDNVDNDDDDSSSSSSHCTLNSNDSTLQSIQFTSHRDANSLEEGISFVWPTDPQNGRRIHLSTLLDPHDLAPLFAGAQWAGTRVWHAAIVAMQYLEEHYGDDIVREGGGGGSRSMLELGCGLGVPGMVWHMLGGRAVLTDQEEIMSQLRRNLVANFADSAVPRDGDGVAGEGTFPTADGAFVAAAPPCSPRIDALPLSWSREGVASLLEESGYPDGFDFVLNCDCVYEPLYGKSWELLVEVIDELLRIRPDCVVVTSVERRTADGVDDFLTVMEQSEHVGNVERALVDEKHRLEIYVTRGNVA